MIPSVIRQSIDMFLYISYFIMSGNASTPYKANIPITPTTNKITG